MTVIPEADAIAMEHPSAYRKVLQGLIDSSAECSVMCAHCTEMCIIATAQSVIWRPGLFLDGHHPRMIVANEEEHSRYNFLLWLDADGERNEDLPGAARWVAEMEAKALTEALSTKYPRNRTKVLTDAKPVLLFSEVKSNDRFSEVFLSPGCRQLTAEELLPAVRAAQLGVHVVREKGSRSSAPPQP